MLKRLRKLLNKIGDIIDDRLMEPFVLTICFLILTWFMVFVIADFFGLNDFPIPRK